MICRRNSLGLMFFISACLTTASVSVGADPIPEKIRKGNLRIELKLVAQGLASPVWLTHAPDGSGRLFILDQSGPVRIWRDGAMVEKPFLDVAQRMVKLNVGFDERGLLGLAFHPGFADSASPGYRLLYTYTSEPLGSDGKADFTISMPEGVPYDHQSVVAQWQVSAADPDTVDINSRRQIMTFHQPQFNHNGGCLLFGPDGMLYIGTGDGGAANDTAPGHSPQGNGQDLSNVLGKVLRIDPLGRIGTLSANGQYTIPRDNPLVSSGGGLAEIWVWGMRNPWRMAFDMETGDLVAADVGQAMVEEVDIVTKGGNYGWRLKEGTFFFNAADPNNLSRTPPAGVEIPALVDPVVQYDHDEGTSITGGFVYRGRAIPMLRGHYVFGDWKQNVVQTGSDGKSKTVDMKGRLFYADLSGGLIQEFLLGAQDRPLGQYVIGFGQDQEGELYLLTNDKNGPTGNGGKVWKIVPVQ